MARRCRGFLWNPSVQTGQFGIHDLPMVISSHASCLLAVDFQVHRSRSWLEWGVAWTCDEFFSKKFVVCSFEFEVVFVFFCVLLVFLSQVRCWVVWLDVIEAKVKWEWRVILRLVVALLACTGRLGEPCASWVLVLSGLARTMRAMTCNRDSHLYLWLCFYFLCCHVVYLFSLVLYCV